MGQDTDLSQKVFNHKPELYGEYNFLLLREDIQWKKNWAWLISEKDTIARECVFSKYSRPWKLHLSQIWVMGEKDIAAKTNFIKLWSIKTVNIPIYWIFIDIKSVWKPTSLIMTNEVGFQALLI